MIENEESHWKVCKGFEVSFANGRAADLDPHAQRAGACLQPDEGSVGARGRVEGVHLRTTC